MEKVALYSEWVPLWFEQNQHEQHQAGPHQGKKDLRAALFFLFYQRTLSTDQLLPVFTSYLSSSPTTPSKL